MGDNKIGKKNIKAKNIINFYSKEMEERGWQEKKLSGSFYSGYILFQKNEKKFELVFYKGAREGTTTYPKDGYIIELRYKTDS